MKDLRPEDRYNVGFFAKGGTNYANTKAVYKTMRRWGSSDGIHFVGDNGHPFIGPLLETKAQIAAFKASADRRASSSRTRAPSDTKRRRHRMGTAHSDGCTPTRGIHAR